MRQLLPIVEGEGDMAAVPELIRRTLAMHKVFDVKILRPHRRGDLPKVKTNFRRFFETAVLEQAPILWVMDFDCDFCNSVEDEEAVLRTMAEGIRRGYPLEVCFIVKEYESLFLFDQMTTRGVFTEMRPEVVFPTAPEEVRDAKGWLSSALPQGSSYKPTAHQKRVTAQLDLEFLRDVSPSFHRFERAVLRLAREEAGMA